MNAEKIPIKVTELYIPGRKVNILIVFVTKSCKNPKDITFNGTNYLFM